MDMCFQNILEFSRKCEGEPDVGDTIIPEPKVVEYLQIQGKMNLNLPLICLLNIEGAEGYDR